MKDSFKKIQEKFKKFKKNGKKSKERKVKLSTLFFSFLLIAAGYITVLAVFIYGLNWQNSFIEKNEKIIPFPAAAVGKNIITISEINDKTNAVRNFYENQDFSGLGIRVDFKTADGLKRLKIKEKQVLDKTIEDKIIKDEANMRGIKITSEMIDQEVDRKLKEYGSADQLKGNLLKLYGWNLDDFKKNIVQPDMYKEQLWQKAEGEDPDLIKAHDKITQAKQELNNRAEFEEVVKKYSEGDSAKNNGDLGWFSADQMLPEIAGVAFTLKKGDVSDVIRSSIGYHIIEVMDTKQENNQDMVRVSQVFIRTKSFSDWLLDKAKSQKVRIFLKDYSWNKEFGQVDFKNQETKQFEDNLMKNSPDDVSVMF